ncbi:MAG: DNA polymerase III subunit beta [bacterium]
MKLSCERQKLIESLSIVQKATDPKSSILVLRNVLMKADDGGNLELSAYDHRMGIRTSTTCSTIETGAVTCPCDVLMDILNVVEDDSVNLSVEEEILDIDTEKQHFKLNCISADDFPPFPQVDEKTTLEINSKALEKGLRQALIATDENDPRVYMGGVFFEKEEGGGINLVATDGRRLSISKITDENAKIPEINMIVPARSLHELARLIHDTEGSVKTCVGERSVSFSFNNVYIVSRLTDADYPNYRRAIPSEFSGTARINRMKLTKAVRGTAIMARSKETQGLFEMELRDESVKFQAMTLDLGSSNIEVEALKKGKDIKLAYNIKFVNDFLNVIDDEEIVIDYTKESGPAVFHSDNPGYSYILMPVRM